MSSAINAYLLSLNPEANIADQWDFGLVSDLLSGQLWRPPDFPVFNIQNVAKLPDDNTAVVVIPARHHAYFEEAMNKELAHLKHVVFFALGDEDGEFKVEHIKHPSIKIWVQNPIPERHAAYRKLGCGCPPHMRQYIPKEAPTKNLDWAFSGQITHTRRYQMIDQLERLKQAGSNGGLNPTEGFTQGLGHKAYYELLAEAKIAPCPSGPLNCDSFRLFEALELGCIPIADNTTGNGKFWHGYWEWLFGSTVPFPTITDYDSLPAYIADLLSKYPANANRISAWWLQQKRKLAYDLLADINSLEKENL
jgi:hypothetical protein